MIQRISFALVLAFFAGLTDLAPAQAEPIWPPICKAPNGCPKTQRAATPVRAPKRAARTKAPQFRSHPGYCTGADYQKSSRAGGVCTTNDAYGTGGAIPVGIRCDCRY